MMPPSIDPQPIFLFVTFGFLIVIGVLTLFGVALVFCALLGAMFGPKAPLPDASVTKLLQKMNGEQERWGKK